MKSKKNAKRVLGLAVVLATAASAYAVRHRSVTPPPVSSAAAVVTAPSPASLAPRHLDAAWARGTERVYALTQESRVTSGGQPFFDLKLEGPLRVTVLRSSPSLLLAFRFEGALSLGGPGAGANSGAAMVKEGDEAHAAFFAEYTSEGALAALRLAPGTSPVVTQIWRAFASSLQLTPAPDRTAAWEADEKDASGTYHARYTAAEGATLKVKDRYTSPPPGSKVLLSVGESRMRFSWGAQGLLDDFDAHERLRAASGGVIDFEGLTDTTMHATGAPTAVSIDDLLAAAELAHADPGAGGAEQNGDAIERAKIGDRTFGGTMAELLAVLPHEQAGTVSEDERKRTGRAYIALAAMLRRQPENVDVARQHVLAQGPLASTLLAALRDAGTPQAQAALRDAMTASALPEKMRFEATRALSTVEAPTRESVAALKGAQGEGPIGTQATYGLGSMAHHLDSLDPSLADEVVQHLVASLRAATTDDQRAAILVALGNAGATEAVDAIGEYVRWPANAVRAAAAQALRRVSSDTADALLLGLLSDSGADVRESAVDALGDHAPSPALIDALGAILTRDPATTVRSRGLNVAAKWLTDAPALAAAVGVVASGDPNESLRNKAKLLLGKRS